jgi:transcription-repair coupling factor (superfamily II helicase)
LGRVPIQTYITAYDDRLVRGAVLRELERQGQAFYVYNEVRTIDRAAERVKRIVPEARVAFAHGQMPAAELEKVMMGFLKKKYDVLVSTTIIESGLDIPSANTIIIENAGEFGLSQLYQLRGRVGRSRLQAYAYLTFPKKKIMTEDARRRLDAIEECDELSMGYSIAMKDLEIRGAGSILGREQHGQISKVGFELYCNLLREEIGRIKGGAGGAGEGAGGKEEGRDVKLDINVNAYLPDHYIADSFLKLNVYRDMMGAEDTPDVAKIRKDLADRFGPVPKETEELLKVVELRVLARKLGISRFEELSGHVIIYYPDDKRKDLVLAKDRDKLAQIRDFILQAK